jgi:hypothetical protein
MTVDTKLNKNLTTKFALKSCCMPNLQTKGQYKRFEFAFGAL